MPLTSGKFWETSIQIIDICCDRHRYELSSVWKPIESSKWMQASVEWKTCRPYSTNLGLSSCGFCNRNSEGSPNVAHSTVTVGSQNPTRAEWKLPRVTLPANARSIPHPCAQFHFRGLICGKRDAIGKRFTELTRVRRTHQPLELVPPNTRLRSDLIRDVLLNRLRHLGTRSSTVVLDLERRLRCSL